MSGMRVTHALVISCAKDGVMPVVCTSLQDVGRYLADEVVQVTRDPWEYGSLRVDVCEIVGSEDE